MDYLTIRLFDYLFSGAQRPNALPQGGPLAHPAC